MNVVDSSAWPVWLRVMEPQRVFWGVSPFGHSLPPPTAAMMPSAR